MFPLLANPYLQIFSHVSLTCKTLLANPFSCFLYLQIFTRVSITCRSLLVFPLLVDPYVQIFTRVSFTDKSSLANLYSCFLYRQFFTCRSLLVFPLLVDLYSCFLYMQTLSYPPFSQLFLYPLSTLSSSYPPFSRLPFFILFTPPMLPFSFPLSMFFTSHALDCFSFLILWTHIMVVYAIDMLALFLCVIHRNVRILDKDIEVVAVIGIYCHTDAEPHIVFIYEMI